MVKNDAKQIVTTVARMKDGAEDDCLVSALEPVDLGDDEDGDEITSCVIVPVEGEIGRATTKEASR